MDLDIFLDGNQIAADKEETWGPMFAATPNGGEVYSYDQYNRLVGRDCCSHTVYIDGGFTPHTVRVIRDTANSYHYEITDQE